MQRRTLFGTAANLGIGAIELFVMPTYQVVNVVSGNESAPVEIWLSIEVRSKKTGVI